MAIIAVVVGHVGEFLYQDHPLAQDILLPGGFLGVDLFLVLSGFLITALLLREVDRSSTIRVVRFWRRRLTRLYPSLLVFLACYLLYAWQQGLDMPPRFRVSGLALVFLTNWQFVIGLKPLVDVPVDLSHLWSLAVEGQFYLVWPPVILALHRFVRRTSTTLILLALGVVGVVLLRAWQYDRYKDWILVYTRTDARFDTFLLGAIVAVLWERGLLARIPLERVRVAAWVGLVGLLVSFVVIKTPVAHLDPLHPSVWVTNASANFLFYGGFTLVSMFGAAAIAGAIDTKSALARGLDWSPLRLAGRASYSIYLFHLPVLVWAHITFEDSLLAATVAGVGGTLLTGGACYLAVERPVLRRRGRA